MEFYSTLASLPHVPPPVLTVYLDINPANPRNQGGGYLSWLKSSGQALGKELPRDARRMLRAQLARIEDYLKMENPRARGLAVFAGSHVWEVVPLQVDVTEELHWGKPSLQQMAWMLDEHRLRGAVLIDGSGARFFRFWLGSVTEDEAAKLFIDYSSWRKPHLAGTTVSGLGKQFGVQRDKFEERVAAQRRRFAHGLAQKIVQWASEGEMSPVVLVGMPEDVDEILAELPADFRPRTAVVHKALSNLSTGDLKKRLEPILRRWEREYEATLVDELLDAPGAKAAIGLDEALAQLQDGVVLELVVARGMTGQLKECLGCGRFDRSADPVCARCGGQRRPRTLRTVLPELASLQGIPIEVVSGEAAKKLRAAGGIAARLSSTPRPGKRPPVPGSKAERAAS